MNGITSPIHITSSCRCSCPEYPLISIITVVYNSASKLSHTIRSVKQQDYENVEYIIIDGGSNDGTCEIIKEHTQYIDYWISEPDKGVYDAMHKGINIAKGDWLLFLGAGDLLINCLHIVAPFLKDSTTVYYGDVYLPKRHILYYGKFSRHKLSRSNLPHQAVFYPKAIFNYHRFDLRYRIMADYVFNIQAYCDSKFNFNYIRTLITIYEDTEGLSTRSRDEIFDKDHSKIIRDNFGVLIVCEYIIRKFFRTFERQFLRTILQFFKKRHIIGTVFL